MFLVALKQYYLGTFLSLLFLKKETVPQPWRAIAQRFGSISIDSKNYRIKNSDALIREVVGFLNESGIEEINR